MASVSFRSIQKRFGRAQVISGISFDISDGEFVVLVGPSGCGKSTLLRMLAGLEEISDGEIAIDGKVINELDSKDRDIAMVFQSYALYPHMTVRDNMGFSLKLRKADAAMTAQRVADAARILNLEPLLARYPRELSGGQRQRVAMGRAIVRDPQVFLFDEPLSNLDAKLRVQTRLEIQKLHRELGVTSLFVTHDQVEAMTLAQRIIVMNGGRIEQMGTPEEVYGQPASTFVASFIGSPAMNLLPGRQQGDRFLIDGAQLAVPPGHEGEFTLGLRPEHAQLASSGWPLRVEMMEMLGAERLVYGKLGSATPFTLRLDATLAPPRPGDVLHLSFRPEHLHHFDTQTGRRR